MLCVHGGGGKAFREWAELWAKRGYVALAMDLAGKGPDGKRHADAGPDQTDVDKFGDFTLDTIGDMWTYHAVAAVVRGHSLLASRPEVDKDRIGITGISWGGYLTCIVAGIDDRLKCAVPVYGCGFLGDNSAWVARLGKMTRRADASSGSTSSIRRSISAARPARCCSSTARTTSRIRSTVIRSRTVCRRAR